MRSSITQLSKILQAYLPFFYGNFKMHQFIHHTGLHYVGQSGFSQSTHSLCNHMDYLLNYAVFLSPLNIEWNRCRHGFVAYNIKKWYCWSPVFFSFFCRGLAAQNKPELQKVMERRKREQVLKSQKEEQEAHKKRSDLEIELMKRRETLEQARLLPHNTHTHY